MYNRDLRMKPFEKEISWILDKISLEADHFGIR